VEAVPAVWAERFCEVNPPPNCSPPLLFAAQAAQDVWHGPLWSDITFGIIVAVITYAAIVLLILSVRAIQKQ